MSIAPYEGVYFIYDGECPVCTSSAQALRLKQSLGRLTTLNARVDQDHPLVALATQAGHDFDTGMVIFYKDRFFQGKDALKFMARHGSTQNIFSAVCKSLFWSDLVAAITYPWMRGVRNRLLKFKNVRPIDNLNFKDRPIFEDIFGESWDDLPPVMKGHYANRPYSSDVVTVDGYLDITCKQPMRFMAPLFWLLKSVPPVNARQVPVTVSFRSDPDSKSFEFDRTFYLPGRKPYAFRSKMFQMQGHEVIEVMRYGMSWRMIYLWDGSKVLLKHKGYALKLFGHFIPLPITALLGRGDAEEIPLDERSFAMKVVISHPLFGHIYSYGGHFTLKEGS